MSGGVQVQNGGARARRAREAARVSSARGNDFALVGTARAGRIGDVVGELEVFASALGR
jgi:hypothetical protein